MKNNQITNEELSNQYKNYMNEIDAIQEQGLDEIKVMQGTRRRILEKEEARLKVKLGEDHSRVREIGLKRRYINGLDQEIDMMIDASQIRPPVFDATSWRLEGRIVNKEGKGIKGLTVGLYDEQGKWVSQLGYGCSDSRGFYHITVTQKSKLADLYASQKLFATVSDQNYKILARDQEALIIKIGNIEYRHFMIDLTESTCTAPEPGKEDTMMPKNVWMVKGQVTDAEGEGIGGAIVSLYDKDLLFDDKLGTTATDESGNYTLIYKKEAFKDLIETNPDLYIKVFDKQGKTIASSRKKIKFNAGQTEVIHLAVKKKVKKPDQGNTSKDSDRKKG